MDFREVLKQRKSVKAYKSENITKNQINNILNAATLAPSWRNKHDWRFIVVTDRELILNIANTLSPNNTAMSGVKEAPALIIISANPNDSNIDQGKEYYLVDSGIAMEHVVLAATNEGLGTCWIADFNEEEIKNLLNVPSDYKIVAFTPLGYIKQCSDDEYRLDIDEIAYYNKWGSNILH